MSVCSIINNKGKIDIFRLMALSVYSALIFAERTTKGCSVAGGGGRGQGEGCGNQDDIWQMLTYRILSEEGFFLVLCLRWYSDSLRPRRTWVPSVSSAAVLNSLGGLHPPPHRPPRFELQAGGGKAKGKPAEETMASSPVPHAFLHIWSAITVSDPTLTADMWGVRVF